MLPTWVWVWVTVKNSDSRVWHTCPVAVGIAQPEPPTSTSERRRDHTYLSSSQQTAGSFGTQSPAANPAPPATAFNGQSNAKKVELAGNFNGKLMTDELTVGSTAVIDGDLKSNALVIELGAEVSGTIGRKS